MEQSLEEIRKLLILAQGHLANAQKDGDLAVLVDCLELAYANTYISRALRECAPRERIAKAS